MQNNKISSHPPKKRTVQDFIAEAESRVRSQEYKEPVEKISYPWEDDSVRPDIKKAFTLQLPEEYILKIKYISEKTGKPQQKLIREIVTSSVDEMLKDLNI